MLSCINFLYRGENICLQWKLDMLPLVQNYGELSSFMLEWVRAWLNPQLDDVKSHMTGPYICNLLMQSVEEAGREGLEVFVDFLHNKYSELPGLDVTTLIVPYSCNKHWSAYILSDYGYFHLDSLISCGLHADFARRICLAKMWCARKGHNDDSGMWAEAQSPHSWIQVRVPQQNSGWACGFYMMKNILEFSKALRYRPDVLRKVMKAEFHFKAISKTFQDKI